MKVPELVHRRAADSDSAKALGDKMIYRGDIRTDLCNVDACVGLLRTTIFDQAVLDGLATSAPIAEELQATIAQQRAGASTNFCHIGRSGIAVIFGGTSGSLASDINHQSAATSFLVRCEGLRHWSLNL